MFEGAVYNRVAVNKLVRRVEAPSRVGISQMPKWIRPTPTPVHVTTYPLCKARFQWKNPLSSSGKIQAGMLRGAGVSFGNKFMLHLKPAAAVIQTVKWLGSTHSAAVQKPKRALLNTRYRRQKQYCQYYTKFGKCAQPDSICSFIHDAERVAVCTYFLKGICRDESCPLSHKPTPERMPDCLYFEQGLCTSEPCLFRHVKLNSKTPTCSNFSSGYCANGADCSFKHTNVCPMYAESGNCPEEATCKLYHPKRKEAVVQQQIGLQRSRRQRGTDLVSFFEDGELSTRLKLFPEPQQTSIQRLLSGIADGTTNPDRLTKPGFVLQE